MKQFLKAMISSMGYEVRRKPRPGGNAKTKLPGSAHSEKGIPDSSFYQPVFSPWLGFGEFAAYLEKARPLTLVSPDRCYLLYSLALQALNLHGEFWECGVYKGGTALLLASLIAEKADPARRPTLRLFDTFEGMPQTDPEKDCHRRGDFADTSVEAVTHHVGYQEFVSFHKGFIPGTFEGLEERVIAFAHVDVDIYNSIADSCQFIYPRTLPGGFVIFDDYGFPTCPGAREAVDDFFRSKPEVPLVLPTGQAVVIKLP
jgi:O-methyltransferase